MVEPDLAKPQQSNKGSMIMRKPLAGITVAALLVGASFAGNFVHDDDVQQFNFTVGAASPNVILRAWSYAGGVNAAGQVIQRGGFDTILALFNSAGTLIGQNDDGGLL